MLESFAVQYGYLAVFLGTLVEGEVFILLGGFLAHLGYMGLVEVVAVAAVGAYAGDLIYFSLGRRYGRALLKKSRRAARLLPWLERFMQKYHAFWLFGVRYLWGMRWLAAILAGSTRMKFSRYSTLDLLACLMWATVVGLLGYGAGEAFERLLGDLKRYEVMLLCLLAFAGALYGIASYIEERRLGRAVDGARDEPSYEA